MKTKPKEARGHPPKRRVLRQGLQRKTETDSRQEPLLERLNVSLAAIRKEGPAALSKAIGDDNLGAVITSIIDFMFRGEDGAVFSFFRQHRPSASAEEQYFLTTLTYRKKEDAFYWLNIPVTSFGDTAKKLSQVIARDKFRMENEDRFNALSPRETEVLRLISCGLSSLEISEELFISKHTVEVHRKKIREKINARNVVDFVHFAEAFDLV